MQKVRSPCGSADLRGTPGGPGVAQWRSALRERFASASSLSWSMWAWATMTSMVENIAGSSWDRVFNRVFLLGEAGDRPAGLARGACQRGWRRRDPACQTRKAPDELGGCVRRLMAIVYASVFWQSIVRTVRSVAARIKQLQRKNAVSIAFERW